MKKSNFVKEYNFDTFVVGDSNKFAYSLAVTATKARTSSERTAINGYMKRKGVISLITVNFIFQLFLHFF